MRPIKALWQRIRRPLARSRVLKNVIASILVAVIRLVEKTNPRVEGSSDVGSVVAAYTPAIAVFWHGQHLLAPALKRPQDRMVALFSRSADAELNALVAEKLGFGIVRGSGGRAGVHSPKKGGASALIRLKRTIDQGCNVAMIADIPHGKPREAGLGVVTLARISGRPLVPVAIATSRRKVLENTWDKTTINLPFGRSALVVGEPIHVSPGADRDEMERKRQEVTAALNKATLKAYKLVDGLQAGDRKA
ncbi:lysophospholipid acyltransferase family protein [Chelativorans sp. Marseille-P2723]|uniref:lysophospholipid acyltransferase family protein n=1 Tax=Chelativorans sp. Marseille-P2723 TaxID=2709133 RepID=UPI00156EDAF4|nr:lysophospholipid acyltransferase family protein [Chelativorans sp. Marseille-P2723]